MNPAILPGSSPHLYLFSPKAWNVGFGLGFLGAQGFASLKPGNADFGWARTPLGQPRADFWKDVGIEGRDKGSK
ncbi:hypothetical protein [Coleofasciculus sp. H7-2]|uniref:hypothetical protein n=1 Tax=Coleofasciculus sp. H7-2 TaxID=3351545 RepID=UPI00366CF88A